jgi:glycosyltransferase involved in cell wall biosynthesis
VLLRGSDLPNVDGTLQARPPVVTIGLPVFNGEPYLAAALDSILAQTCEDFEIIISDNASTDATPRICAAYMAKDSRIRYYRHERNLGASRNFNYVFELARGQYFKWASYDDLIAPTFLERCLEALERESTVVLAYSQTNNINEEGRVTGFYADGLDLRQPSAHQRFRKFLATPGHCHPVFGLYRIDVLRRTPLIGNYPRSDRNLIGEIALRGQIAEIPERLFYRRHHPLTSTNVHKTESELAAWFDPTARGRLVFPRVRRFVEYCKSIRRVPIPVMERIYCYALVARYVLYPKRWIGIGDDLQTAVKKSIALASDNGPAPR